MATTETDVRSLRELVHPTWVAALEPVEERIRQMGQFLRREVAQGRQYLPEGKNILRAFTYPMDQVRVLIVGQDPYPTPGNAVGLSFSVSPDTKRIPASLRNIFAEYQEDLGHPKPVNGDLTPWAENGVMLLNRVLSVQPGNSGSHRRKGWEEVTDAAIGALVAREQPLVAILWGRDAQTLTPLLGQTAIIASAHPSPMSADRGFFGSKPFSRANELLEKAGGEPVEWKL